MSDPSPSIPDAARYRASLDILINKAYDEYKIAAVDVPKLQAGYIRTYLWLSSVLAAFELRIFVGIVRKDFEGITFLFRQPTPCFYLLFFLAVGLSAAAFALATDTLRGRGVQRLPLGDPMQFANMAYSDAMSGKETMRPSALVALHNEIIHLRFIRLKRTSFHEYPLS